MNQESRSGVAENGCASGGSFVESEPTTPQLSNYRTKPSAERLLPYDINSANPTTDNWAHTPESVAPFLPPYTRCNTLRNFI